jgi:hypothetical protein
LYKTIKNLTPCFCAIQLEFDAWFCQKIQPRIAIVNVQKGAKFQVPLIDCKPIYYKDFLTSRPQDKGGRGGSRRKWEVKEEKKEK